MYIRPLAPDGARGVLRAWHPLERDPGDTRVTTELAASIRHSENGLALTDSEVEIRLGELRSLIKAAQRGELSSASWTPVRRQPDLWELRLWWPGDTPVRIYFHEPDQPAHQTVVALVHVKVVVPGNPSVTNALQDAQMDEASRRVMFGRGNSWGLDSSQPLFPDAQPGLPPAA